MAGIKRLTLLVEGDGDAKAAPTLVSRLLEKHGGSAVLFPDEPMRVGNLFNLVRQGNETEWLRFVRAAAKRKDLAGIILLIDGDCDGEPVFTSQGRKRFCAATIAEFMASRATEAGAGALFSLAVVFARQEYESWLIAGNTSMNLRLRAGVALLDGDLEVAPRGAKEWLVSHRQGGYKPTQHQKELTQSLDLHVLQQKMRSFRHLEKALCEIIVATREGRYVLSPTPPGSRA